MKLSKAAQRRIDKAISLSEKRVTDRISPSGAKFCMIKEHVRQSLKPKVKPLSYESKLMRRNGAHKTNASNGRCFKKSSPPKGWTLESQRVEFSSVKVGFDNV